MLGYFGIGAPHLKNLATAAMLSLGVLLIGVTTDGQSAAAQDHSVVACRDPSGTIVPCGESGDDDGGDYYNSGGCNVICQGMRDLFSIGQPSGPSPDQVAHSQAIALHNQGSVLYQQGRDAEAIELWRRALEIYPSDTGIIHDYWTLKAEDDRRNGNLDAALREVQNAIPYDNTGTGAKSILQSIQADLADRDARANRQAEQAKQQFTDGRHELLSEVRPLGSASSADDLQVVKTNGAFGSTDLKPRELSDDAGWGPPKKPVGGAKTALDQLSSVQQSGSDAATHQPRDEATRNESGCGFDTAGCAKPDSPTVPKIGGGDSPTLAALKSRIPQGVNDPRIAKSVAWFAKLERMKADKQSELAAVQKQIDGGQGDPVVLAKKQIMETDLGRIAGDEKTATHNIDRALKDDGMTWNEATTAGQPPASDNTQGQTGAVSK